MSQVPIKETSSDLLSRVAYWPGHVIAESLAIGSTAFSSSGTAETNNATAPDRLNSIAIKPGSAFSAIIGSMLPIELLTANIASSNSDNTYVYDEFGFRIEPDECDSEVIVDTDGLVTNGDSQPHFVNIRLSPVPQPHKASNKKVPNGNKNSLPSAFVEDSKHKLKWIAYLGRLSRPYSIRQYLN